MYWPDFPLWWCCTVDPEKCLWQGLLVVWATLVGFIPLDSFEALASTCGLEPGTPAYDAFLLHEDLTPDTILIGEVMVDVLVFETAFWTAFAEYAETSDFDCPDPCNMLPFPR